MSHALVVGTFDTKDRELRYVADRLVACGLRPLLVDLGTGGGARPEVDVTAEEVAAHHPDGAAAVLGLDDRGRAVTAMAAAFERFVLRRNGSCDDVGGMTLEHYPGMTEKQLAAIEREAGERWPLSASLIVHRYGRLAPGDRIVLAVTASDHRQAAFEACAFLIDWLKTKAPFWKCEETSDGPKWVEARTEDNTAAARWHDD